MTTRPAHPGHVPYFATAQRPSWDELPDQGRALIEARLPSPVVKAESQRAGFTPGFASRLWCADGSQAFVKAAPTDHPNEFVAPSYREEVQKVRLLPPEARSPHLLWHHDDGQWIILCFEAIDGRPPARPWIETELALVTAALTEVADALTPPPPGHDLMEISALLGDAVEDWSRIREGGFASGPVADRLDETVELALAAAEHCHGNTLVHLDLRDDNIVIGNDGQVWICDWNWPAIGAAWVDLVSLLIAAYGDGHDVDAILAAHPLSRDVESEAIDSLIAWMYGFFVVRSLEDEPAWSPYLRQHQRWQGEVVGNWLAARRGWN